MGVFVLVQLRFAQLAKYGTLSQPPEAVGVIVPPDAYAQPYMLPPKHVISDKEGETEPAGTAEAEVKWERFEAFDEEQEGVKFKEKSDESKAKRIDPEAETTLVVEPRLRPLKQKKNRHTDELRDGPMRSPRLPPMRRSQLVPTREEPKKQMRSAPSPRPLLPVVRQSSVVDDLSPRNTSSPKMPGMRDRSVTSFMVMSPHSARVYSHSPLPKPKHKEEGGEHDWLGVEEMEEVEPVVIAAQHPHPSSPSPPDNTPFGEQDVEMYMNEIV